MGTKRCSAQGLTSLEVAIGNGGNDKEYQCCIILLEARTMELLGVARREPKRKRVPAGNEGRRTKVRAVTPNRPEAIVI